MAVVGVTGHSNITDPTVVLVYKEILRALSSRTAELVGMTCLARGADQVFADAVLELGGALSVVIPADDYFDQIEDSASRERCQHYLASATTSITMDNETSGPDAYLDASRYLVDHCDRLLAIWDGSSSSGTSDAVAYALQKGRAVTVIWPDGAERS